MNTSKVFDKDRIFVYRNLHKNLFSLRRNGKVFAHSNVVFLSDVIFKVSENRRLVVLSTGRKNVHAGASGVKFCLNREEILAKMLGLGNSTPIVKVHYNPYKFDSFVNSKNVYQKLSGADHVLLTPDGVWAFNPRLKP